MKVIGQSVVKAENDIFENNVERLNEDAWSHQENVVAVADGAGGTGLFADKWARKLVNSIPSEPFSNTKNIENWISGFWEDFYNQHFDKVQSDVWKLKKFEAEGSAATLSVLWHIGDAEYIYESYGDTALFVYNKELGELSIQDNLHSINSFTRKSAFVKLA